MKAVNEFLQAIPGPRNNGAEWQTIHEFLTDVIDDYDPGMSDEEQLELLASVLAQLEEATRVMGRELAWHRLKLSTAPKDIVKCPYCRGGGIGQYWYHALNETTDADCHVCGGAGNLAKKDLPSALEDLPDDFEDDDEDDEL